VDVSLFPNLWPDRVVTRGRQPTCCEFLTPPENVRIGVWRAVHQMGHSRVAFNAHQLAVLADSSTPQARYAIGCAVNLGWVVQVQPEPYMNEDPALYQGALPKR
jgi:hypothetical protein